MNDLKRKLAVSVAVAACLLGLCSCSFFRAEQLTALTGEESKRITQQSNEIVRCLTERDKEGLSSLFCQKVRERDTFQQEIDAIFDYFACEVYIQADVDGLAGGGASSEAGKRTKWYVTPKITYIEVLQPSGSDSGELVDRYYGVRYYWAITDVEHPELEGLHHLELTMLNTDTSVEAGTEEST